MKKRLLLAALLTVFAASLHAQSADTVTKLLESEKADLYTVSYICCVSADLALDTVSPEHAFDILSGRNLVKADSGNTEVTWSLLALIVSDTWNIKESLMYTLFHNERYAFKQLKALGIIPSNANPHAPVSGSQVLDTLTMTIELYREAVR